MIHPWKRKSFEKFIENCQIKVIKEMSNPHANYLCWGNKKIIIYDDQFNELNQKIKLNKEATGV